MRRFLTFQCEGSALAATIDEAEGACGLLIVSGGNEIRIGAHRGMAKLAREVAATGFPVFRFDRRGIGDSEGENCGYTSSGPDIEAALAAFRTACPQVRDIVCFGNCDAASALIFNETSAKALILANPWVVEPVDDLPPPAAIKARYLAKLRDPREWVRLISGGINIKKAFSGLKRVSQPSQSSSLFDQFVHGLTGIVKEQDTTTILLASGDGTALAFKSEWEKPKMGSRFENQVRLISIESSSHSFTDEAAYATLKSTLFEALSA